MKSLIESNIYFLQQGVELIEGISDEQYLFDDSDYFQSSIGKHVRHIFDHYQSLISGWHNKVDYDARIRDTDIESKRKSAIDKCQLIIHQLRTLQNSSISVDQRILVKSNEDAKTVGSSWSSSSIKRELQFLIGHTVHHYALIAFILKVQGISVPESLGMAPSTVDYQEQHLQKNG